MQAIEENGRLSLTKFNQVQEELRRGELLNHNKKVKALEKKNTEQEKKHARMIMMLDRVVDSQDNQLKHQKFEMGEQLREHTQELQDLKELKEKEVKELKELRVKELKEQKELRERELREVEVEQGRKHSQEVKEMKEAMDIGVEKLKVEHDAKVHKLEEDNKVLKSQVERFKVDSKETC